jgi:hypothetical protein
VRRIDLELDLFSDPADRELNEAALRHVLEALTISDQLYLRRHPSTPHLYAAGVRYEAEPIGTENWQAIPYVLARRRADCEDLSAYLCAWKREREGIAAVIDLTYQQVGNLSVYHIRVRNPDGTIEDPSRVLGMGAT